MAEKKKSTEATVRNIRRKTRRKYSAEEKGEDPDRPRRVEGRKYNR
jgi:hypothetical protein